MRANLSITPQGFTALVRGIAAENPYFVYQVLPTDDRGASSCFYSEEPQRNGLPARCIIGEAYARLGVPVPSSETGALVTSHIYDHLGLYPEEHTAWDTAIRWCGMVQAAQDRHEPWGVAIEYADHHVSILPQRGTTKR